MARGKKTAKELTPEEKLAQALVPIEEQPYKIPENWCYVPQRIICKLSNGEKMEGKEYPYLEVKYLRGKKKADILTKGKYIKESTKVILVDGENSGEVFTVFEDGYMGSTFKALDISSVVNQDYLLYFIATKKELYRNNKKGSAIPHLNKELFFSMPFPLAPLAEQVRIVDRIESIFAKLDEAKEKAQEVVDGFELRKSAILHKAFTGELTKKWRKKHKFTSEESFVSIQKELLETKRKKIKKMINNVKLPNIPKEWKYVDLDEIAKKITDGEHSTPNRVDEFCGYYLLSARNVRNDKLDLDNVDYVDRNEYEKIRGRCNPKKNDILISCSGSVGRTCVINDNNYYVMVRSAALVSVVGCNPRFIMYMIMSGTVQGEIKMLSKQTAQANFFIGAIAALKIPFPPIEEQNEIMHLLDNLIQKEKQAKETAEEVIAQIDTMKKAVLARAFRGELGTNDPEEESAMELLKSVINL